MEYSKAKLKGNDKAFPCSRPFCIENASEKLFTYAF
jgi:hypothetical protein